MAKQNLKTRAKNEFTKVMSERSNDELKEIVSEKRNSYNPEALKAAELEAEKRKIYIDYDKIKQQENNTTTKKPNIPPSKKAFIKLYGNLSESEVQQEILYTHKLSLDKLESIRKNTSMLIWFLVVIPILLVILNILF